MMGSVLNKLHKFALMGLLCVNWASPQNVQAQSTQGPAETDCTDTSVDYSSTETMTQAEKIAAMDRALNQSLNKYDACVSETTNQSSANGGGSGGGNGQGGQSSQGQGEDEAAQGQSTEAAGISGTSIPPTSQATASTADDETNATENPAQQQQGLANGKIPEDIPSENNDDILAQRIRSAAETETDPDKQARLWNEYRKYKGLPQK